MKQCSTCREEFADKFSFCPVDGTPLMEHADAPAFQPPLHQTEQTLPATPAAVSDSYAMDSNEDVQAGAAAATAPAALAGAGAEYHLTFVDDTGLTRRLMGELKEVAQHSELTWPEFKRDP
ncbi:MAG TPA: hypothetical protein VM095_12025, partial [Pyrinomonadaceae bacterium]|nr:hypothetical protein [Pyrinomonadaceae bacterium]